MICYSIKPDRSFTISCPRFVVGSRVFSETGAAYLDMLLFLVIEGELTRLVFFLKVSCLRERSEVADCLDYKALYS